MMMEITLNSKYKPLRDLKTRNAVITGGRGSGKSFATAVILLGLTFRAIGKTIIYTRYTLVNAESSIMPEFMDKIQLGNMEHMFTKSGNDIINNVTGTKIQFRGIKISTGINTAALKSIPNLILWVNDESEEFVDECTFDTIDLSIRDKDFPCQVWFILNPPDIQHFVYRKFFHANGVEDVWNGVKGDTTYIHTTYLDNLKHLPKDYIEKAKRCKEVDIDKYNNIWLGKWASLTEGRIYKGWRKIPDADYPTDLPCWYGVDWGFSQDPAAVVRICFDASTHTIFLHQVLYERGLLTAYIAQAIKEDMRNRQRTLYHTSILDVTIENWEVLINGYSVDKIGSFDAKLLPASASDVVAKELDYIYTFVGEVYCDPARPEQIREMKIIHGLMATGAVNKDKTGRIEYLKYFNVCYTESSKDLHNEYVNYRWKQSKTDKSRFINEPEDGNDHLMDSINYGVSTHLRRLGIANKLGEQ